MFNLVSGILMGKSWLFIKSWERFFRPNSTRAGNAEVIPPTMEIINTLPQILCGSPSGNHLGTTAIDQLKTSISKFTSRAQSYLDAGPVEDLLIFGPFCGRVLLENGCAAIVGRFDPFRVIYLSEFQSQPQYSLNKRVNSAFNWTGDVIPKENEKDDLWNADQDVAKIGRALFSKHVDHLFWKPAVNALLDEIATKQDVELSDVLAWDPDQYITQTRGRLVQLYSQLSKGVHWEFFNSTLQIDEITVKSLLRDALVHLAGLGLVSHFVPTAYSCLSKEAAIQSYITFRKAVP